MPNRHPFSATDRKVSGVMAKIIIETTPPEQMRLEAYREPGCGDWYWDVDGNLHVQIACSGDLNVWDDETSFLVALHELCESRLCFKAGVTQGSVDSFDAAFTGEGEPGDDPAAPYQKQHRAAMLVEHLMAILLGKWDHGEMA